MKIAAWTVTMATLLGVMGCAGLAAAPKERGPVPAVQARLRPPGTLNCDRNRLTSFSGIVTAWSRDDTLARLSMTTDAETRETFTVRFERAAPPEKWFLLGGEVFREQDWQNIEISRGRLRPAIQATVWICEGSANPVVDWRVAPR